MSNKPHHIIHKPEFVQVGDEWCIVGYSGKDDERFQEDTLIRTSKIVAVETRNSVYELKP